MPCVNCDSTPIELSAPPSIYQLPSDKLFLNTFGWCETEVAAWFLVFHCQEVGFWHKTHTAAFGEVNMNFDELLSGAVATDRNHGLTVCTLLPHQQALLEPLERIITHPRLRRFQPHYQLTP